MGCKVLFSSCKELRRKARKREELRLLKEQWKNDSVIYCNSSRGNRTSEDTSTTTKSRNAREKFFETCKPCNGDQATKQHHQQKTIAKSQRKVRNPRRIVGVTNEEWGHLQGLQFSLRSLNHTTLLIFDLNGKDYITQHTTEHASTAPSF